MQKRTGEWPLGPLLAQNRHIVRRVSLARHSASVWTTWSSPAARAPGACRRFALAIAARPPQSHSTRQHPSTSPSSDFGDLLPFRNAYTCETGAGYRERQNSLIAPPDRRGSRRRELTGGRRLLKHRPGVADPANPRAPRARPRRPSSQCQRKHPMAAINSVADLAIDGEVARGHHQLPAGERAVAGRSRRPQARRRGGGGEWRGQGDRHHLRRADLHRRRRHFRIRQAARRAPPSRRARRDRERIEAGHRRAARNGARGRVRGRADRALPHRRPVGQMRPAGNQARPHPRRRAARNACRASSASRRRSTSSFPGAPFGAREAKEWGVVDELAEEGKLRESALAFARRLIAEKAPLKKVRDRSDKLEPARGHPEIFEAIRKANAQKIPRLRGLGEGDRVGEERGRPAVRRGHGQGARRCSWRSCRRRSPRRSGYVFFAERQAAKVADIGPDAPTKPIAQRRRDRRRHHGRRHRDEFPLGRHSRHHRRDLEGSARPRRLDHAPQLRDDRQEGPPDDDRGRGADGQACAHARLQRAGRGRPRDRSGVREHGPQERRSSSGSTRSPSPARSSPRTPPTSTSTKSPR